MKNNLLLSIILFLLWVMSACTQCNNTTYYLGQSEKDFTSFKNGSYWIMKDSVTGAIDSFVVFDQSNSIGDIAGSTNKCNDRREVKGIFMNEYNTSTGQKIDSVLWKFTIAGNSANSDICTFTGEYGQVFLSASIDCAFPFNDIANNIMINGVQYDSVLVNNNVYAHPSVKILKIRLTKPVHVVWELVRAEMKY